jgi:hypothetical protein
MRSTVGLDAVEKSFYSYRKSNPDSSAIQPVAIVTELPYKNYKTQKRSYVDPKRSSGLYHRLVRQEPDVSEEHITLVLRTEEKDKS